MHAPHPAPDPAPHPAPHFAHWPRQFPHSLTVPATSLWTNVEIAALRFPRKAATIFYGEALAYDAFVAQAQALAGYLQHDCGVGRGDRVLLQMQNSPQFMLAYQAILRADAVVVPVSPMNVTDELEHNFADSGARVAIVGGELADRLHPLLGRLVDRAVVATYADYLGAEQSLPVPDVLRAPRASHPDTRLVPWHVALGAARTPAPHRSGPDDLAAILYTSGTTGRPKGCIHPHRTLMCTAVGGALWEGMTQDSVVLGTAPMFHVTGMQHSMNAALYTGATVVLLPRWDPAVAGAMIERFGCTHWANVPTMVVDLLGHPSTADRDLSSLRNIFGGGASMPQAVAAQLQARCGIEYMEAYGMTESISQTHMNPPQQLRKQCLGIPTFDTAAMVVDPETLRPLPPGEVGEILSSGPQLMTGYWNNPQATAEVFVDIDGRRYLRTGDLGRVDADGFFYIADRLKRMINASGYKVWPAELEAALHGHPGILEVAIVSAPDARRGETVKAFVVRRNSAGETLTAEALTGWCREHMAAYKVPRAIEFVDALPRSGTGKIQWRTLQEREWARAAGAASRSG